jgi:hypothetical protein
MRDIYVNDIIYIQKFDQWKEYRMSRKCWNDFDVTFNSKIAKIGRVFEKIIDTNIANNKPDINNNTIKKMLNLQKFIYTKEYDVVVIKDFCKDLFDIHL